MGTYIMKLWTLAQATPKYVVSKNKKIIDPTLSKNADVSTFFDAVSKNYGKMGLFFVSSEESVWIIVRKQLTPHLKDIET